MVQRFCPSDLTVLHLLSPRVVDVTLPTLTLSHGALYGHFDLSVLLKLNATWAQPHGQVEWRIVVGVAINALLYGVGVQLPACLWTPRYDPTG